eukprot:5941758-Prorocentrum_lima.AAC.1
MGDFNVRLQMTLEEEEPMIGPYHFDLENITLHRQVVAVQDNRQRFIDYLSGLELRVMNTYFQKPTAKLITYREMSTRSEDPLTRGHYETLDFVLTAQRWRNA